MLTTLVFLEAPSAQGPGYCTDLNGRTDRGREKGVIYAEVEEMIEGVDKGGRGRVRERGRQKTDRQCNLCRAMCLNRTWCQRVGP